MSNPNAACFLNFSAFISFRKRNNGVTPNKAYFPNSQYLTKLNNRKKNDIEYEKWEP